MHGNVCEQVQDRWHEGYENAPADGRAWESGSILPESDRVVRGGNWNSARRQVGSPYREYADGRVRGRGTGFRVAQEL